MTIFAFYNLKLAVINFILNKININSKFYQSAKKMCKCYSPLRFFIKSVESEIID